MSEDGRLERAEHMLRAILANHPAGEAFVKDRVAEALNELSAVRASLSEPAGEAVAWRLECPVCEEVALTEDPKTRYCGICAQDNGRDVRMRRRALVYRRPETIFRCSSCGWTGDEPHAERVVQANGFVLRDFCPVCDYPVFYRRPEPDSEEGGDMHEAIAEAESVLRNRDAGWDERIEAADRLSRLTSGTEREGENLEAVLREAGAYFSQVEVEAEGYDFRSWEKGFANAIGTVRRLAYIAGLESRALTAEGEQGEPVARGVIFPDGDCFRVDEDGNCLEPSWTFVESAEPDGTEGEIPVVLYRDRSGGGE